MRVAAVQRACQPVPAVPYQGRGQVLQTPGRVLSSCPAAAASSSGATAPLRVCVLGGGVVGLTTALRLLQATAGEQQQGRGAGRGRLVEVTVAAAEFGAETTTAGAAGLWGPYKLSDTPESLINAWGADTFDHLMRLAHSDHAVAAGVALCAVNSFYSEPQPLPFWRDVVYNFQLMDERMLDQVRRRVGGGAASSAEPPPLPCNWGYHWNSVVCEGSRYLPWLTDKVEALGGRLQRLPGRLGALEELPAALAAAAADASVGAEAGGRGGGAGGRGRGLAHSPDVVINTTGLGSRELLKDEQVYPIRGQILRVRAPWVTQAYFFDPFYIIPNRDTVVLGGTGQQGNYSREVSEADRRNILEGCKRLLPSLEHAEIVSDWVGLRPGRTRLRLEVERGGTSGGATAGVDGAPLLVHNYGHGGAGLTLAWGCAGEVVRLLQAEGVL